MGGPHPASTSLDCPPALAGPDHRPHSQEQRNQSSEKSQSLECHRAPIPWGEGGVSLTPPQQPITAVGGASAQGAQGMGLLGPQLPPLLRRTRLCWQRELLCRQPLPSSQGWDSSSACSRKSRPHFPPGASAQRDPLGRDRAFLRKRGVRVQGVGERVTKKKKKK